jgi:hypothetical protein
VRHLGVDEALAGVTVASVSSARVAGHRHEHQILGANGRGV